MSKTFERKCYEKSGVGTNNKYIKCMNNNYEILCTCEAGKVLSSVSNRFLGSNYAYAMRLTVVLMRQVLCFRMIFQSCSLV